MRRLAAATRPPKYRLAPATGVAMRPVAQPKKDIKRVIRFPFLSRRLAAAALIAFATLVPVAVDAATRYVTDELRISVRTGAGNQFRILEVIDSGTRLETGQQSGDWTQVETPEGTSGWVRQQYLTDEPIAKARLEETRTELDEARSQINSLEDELAETQAEAREARSEVDTLEDDKAELEQQLADAEEGLQLSDENERLRRRLSELNTRISDLQEQAQSLRDRERREWFMIGSGVLFGGILFGIIVTRIPWRRRRDRMF